MQAIASLTRKPADILGLNSGRLKPDAPADICIFDPQADWVVNDRNWQSTGRNTPYWGHTLRGRVKHTIQAGQIIYSLTEQA
jgi:dihydroorotase